MRSFSGGDAVNNWSRSSNISLVERDHSHPVARLSTMSSSSSGQPKILAASFVMTHLDLVRSIPERLGQHDQLLHAENLIGNAIKFNGSQADHVSPRHEISRFCSRSRRRPRIAPAPAHLRHFALGEVVGEVPARTAIAEGIVEAHAGLRRRRLPWARSSSSRSETTVREPIETVRVLPRSRADSGAAIGQDPGNQRRTASVRDLVDDGVGSVVERSRARHVGRAGPAGCRPGERRARTSSVALFEAEDAGNEQVTKARTAAPVRRRC